MDVWGHAGVHVGEDDDADVDVNVDVTSNPTFPFTCLRGHRASFVILVIWTASFPHPRPTLD